jgi:hypothetical protein
MAAAAVAVAKLGFICRSCPDRNIAPNFVKGTRLDLSKSTTISATGNRELCTFWIVATTLTALSKKMGHSLAGVFDP